MNLKDYIRSIPDYPKKGILFRDITTLIKDENAFAETINQIVERSKEYKFTKIAAIESRGFVFVINLFDLGGSDNLVKNNYKVENLIEFPGH